MAGSAQDRTEQATPRRREDARKKGQVAKSADLNAALNFIAGLFVFKASFALSGSIVSNYMVSRIANLAHMDLSESGAFTVLVDALLAVLLAAAPMVLTAAVTGFAANVAQVGLMITPEALAPQLSRIDPVAGLGRVFSKKALLETAKSIVKAVVIGYYGYTGLKAKMPEVVMASSMELKEGLRVAWQTAFYVGSRLAFPLLFIGAVDYAYQRWDYEKNLRMTKQELKEEIRQQEGDPMIKAKIRQRQRQIAMHRMMEDVKTADVVVTNPTHYAVAIKYDREKMRAPKVVAKGQRLIAQRIREIAQEAQIPIVENPPVAQALYKSVEVGREIPPDLYRAVAEILAFVYRLSRERGGTVR